MTKSIKEKNRLKKIRTLEYQGLPITADLIKIKMTYRINSLGKEGSGRLCLYTNEFVRAYLSEYFKKRMPFLINDVANSIKKYKFKICFETKIVGQTKGNLIYFSMILLDNKGKEIYKLLLPESTDENTICNPIFSLESFHPIQHKTFFYSCLDEVIKKIQSDVLIGCFIPCYPNKRFLYILQKEHKQQVLNFLRFKNLILKAVFKENLTINIYLSYSTIVQMCFLTKRTFHIFPLTTSHSLIKMENVSNFEFLKILVDLNIIKNGISEEDFNQSTIEDVIEFLKIENY